MSAGVAELQEALTEGLAVGLVQPTVGEGQWRTVHLLETVQEHRAVGVREQPACDVDLRIGADPEEVPVVGTVMDGAQAEAVRDGRVTAVRIAQDVAGFKQSRLVQPAHCAPSGVRDENLPAEHDLVEAAACFDGDVPPLGGVDCAQLVNRSAAVAHVQ